MLNVLYLIGRGDYAFFKENFKRIKKIIKKGR